MALKDGRLDALSAVNLLSGWEVPWPPAPLCSRAGPAPRHRTLLCSLPSLLLPTGPTAPVAGSWNLSWYKSRAVTILSASEREVLCSFWHLQILCEKVTLFLESFINAEDWPWKCHVFLP